MSEKKVVKKDTKIKEKKDNSKKIITIGCIILGLLLIVLLVVFSEKQRKEEEARINKIQIKMDSKYEYFDVSVDDFYDKYKQSNSYNSISSLDKNDSGSYANTYTIGKINLYSSPNDEKIYSIEYDISGDFDFENKEEVEDSGLLAFGNFLGNELFKKNESNEYWKNVTKYFNSPENMWNSNKNKLYYNHLLVSATIDDEKQKAYVEFKPIEENCLDDYLSNLNTKITKEKEEKEIKEKNKIYFDMKDIRWSMSGTELESKKDVSRAYRDYSNADGKKVYFYSDNEKYPKSETYSLYDVKERQYWFYSDSEKLNSYMLSFYRSSYSDYVEIKNTLIQKYGNPSEENFNFNDETYKDDPEKAMSYKYLTIYTKWTNQPDFDIIIQWGELATLTYCEKGYNGNWKD